MVGRDRPGRVGQRDRDAISGSRSACAGPSRACDRPAEAWQRGLSEEFVLYDLRRGLDAHRRGHRGDDVEEILDAIFSTFCIGK